MQRLKAKGKQKATTPNTSRPGTPANDTDLAYQRTRDGFIESLKIVKAATEATSFLGPLKAVCEISIQFLEATRAVNENTKGFTVLRESVSVHIRILDEGYTQFEGARRDQMPDALKDFDDAFKDYVTTLKSILSRMDELRQDRAHGVKGLLRKIADAKVETGIITDYKQEIMQATRVFEDITKLCQIQLEAEVWKMARLGPEKPRPMGTQHKTCLQGTRVPILTEIREWRLNPNVEKRIFWLCDIGGSGKSTVALTLCKEWDSIQEIVVGRFFFSKNARQTSETDDFCSIVAEDIGAQDGFILEQIKSRKAEDPHLFIRGIRHQFTKLIEEPLRLANTTIVLVIDAVDECNKEMRRELLNLLVEKVSSMANLKLLITSRPETDIIAILQGKAIVRGMHFKMHGKEDQSNLDDITAYVNRHLFRLLTMSQRQQLVQRSNGLFIWITTAHLELQQAQGPDAVRATLESLLNRGEGGDINQVYAGIIRRLQREKSYGIIHKVMGIILGLFEPVSTEALAKITDIAHSQLQLILASIQSVFRIDKVVEFLHPTFREYLVSSHNLDRPFDSATLQSDLAISILGVFQEDLKEDICGICQPDEPYPDNAHVLDLDGRLEQVWRASPALSYSVRYWGYHTGPFITEECVIKVLHTFLVTRVLYLIELLSLMGQIHLIQNFEEVHQHLENQGLGAFEAELCQDAIRLVQRHQKTLEKSALHVYSSALLYLPRKTKLWMVYGNKFSGRLPSIAGVPSENWPSYRTLVGSMSMPLCLVFSPNGLRVASGSADHAISVWDTVTGAIIGMLGGHTGAVCCLAFSLDGLQIASGSRDQTLRLWDAVTGTCIDVLEGHTDRVTCLAFSPDSLYIASGSRDATLRFWEAKIGTCIRVLQGHTDEISHLQFSQDGLCIISISCGETTIRFWDATTGESIRVVEGHTNVICCLTFSPNGLQIASGSRDSTLRLWDATNYTSIRMLEGHTDSVDCLAFSPNGLQIASGSLDQTLRLWDTVTGSCVRVLEGHTGEVYCLAFSPNGFQIASGSHDATLRLWDTATGTCTGVLEGHYNQVSHLKISPDGRCIISASHDGTVRLWDMRPGIHNGVPEGRTIVDCLAFSPDGLYIASGSNGGTLRLWDAKTTAIIGVLEGNANGVSSLKFSPDGLRIASGSFDGIINLWDVTSGASIRIPRAHNGDIYHLAFSPDGLCIASAADDSTLRLWDVATMSCLGYCSISSRGYFHFTEDGKSIQCRDGRAFNISQGTLEPLPFSATAPNLPHSQRYIELIDNEMWSIFCPHRKFKFPQEFLWFRALIHEYKIAVVLGRGQFIVIDFTDLSNRRAIP